MSTTFPDLTFRPKLSFLSEPQIDEIHSASLEVLERTGMVIKHPRILEALSGAGCRVSGERVRFPSYLVEECIRKAPKRLVLGDRNGKRNVFLQSDYSWFGPSLDCLSYLDPVDGSRGPMKTEHCEGIARLVDGLPNFKWSMTTGMIQDCPPTIADKIAAKIAMTHTEKALIFCCNSVENLKDIYEMALVVRDGKENFDRAPLLVHYSETLAPLTYYGPAMDKLIFCCEHHLPVIIVSAPQSGATGPASLVGNLVLANAEALSGLVISQIISPGAPFVYGIQSTIMDMRTTIFCYGAVEQTMILSAAAQMARFYGLPIFSVAGCTDSKYNDAQAGIEAAISCLAITASGSGLVHDCGGWLDHGSIASPENLVMVNEIVTMVMQYMKGMPTNPESLAVDLIDEIGPGGNYLLHPSTRKLCREMFIPKLFDRSMAEKPGQPKFDERLRTLTMNLMKHEPAPLAEDKARELSRMEASWRKSLS